mmetsp:Transcript_916/g.2844  ORF Transcript_916/g.2844 Transcript_916/m.2844 type:complete len:492 (+) Transcript_916:151-1626(+)
MPDRAFIMSPSPRLAVLVLLASSCHGILALDKVSLPRGAPLRPALGSAVSGSRVPRGPVLSAATASALPPSGGASMPSTIANLAKNIVGSGVLALAAGVAAVSSNRAALVPAIVLTVLLGAISAYTFSLIARVGVDVGAPSYYEAWGKAVSERSSVLVSAAITFTTCAAALSYAIIIGDSLASIATLAGAPALLTRPNPWIILTSVLVLFPLSLLRDLSALAFGSVIGNAGTLFTAMFTLLRLADGSYAPGGRFHMAIAEASRPKLNPSDPIVSPGLFVLISMLSTAYVAHYNAPRFYQELAANKDGSSKLPKFNKVVAGGFGLAALFCASIMSGGFLTFGSNAQGLILNNYATTDTLALISRVGIGASIIFAYPINFVALRSGVFGLLNLDRFAHRRDVHVGSTIALMMAFNGLALKVKDLGLVIAIGGAVLGSTIVYILPALMFLFNMRRKAKAGAIFTKGQKLEVLANKALLVMGTALGVLGVYTSLK